MKKIPPSLWPVTALISALILSGCVSNRLTTKPFTLPESHYTNWDDVFKQAPPLKLEVLNTGSIDVPLSGLLNLKNPAAKHLKEKTVVVYAQAFLLTKGDSHYLIDTGFDSSFSNRGGNIRGWITHAERYRQNPEEDLVSQLNNRGVTVETVFFTHLHPDHMSGVPELPNSTRLVFDKKETYINYPPLIGTNQLQGKSDIRVLDFSRGTDMPILGKCIDIFGDGSLWAISTPGHSTGHLSWLVVGSDTVWLVTGDASHTEWGFRNGVEPGSFNTGKRSEALASLKRLRTFADQYSEKVTVLYGHDQPGYPVNPE